ncbi:hypothetical protein RRG08_015240 [Elysia crispata]|uniref:C1q domain-containing protein n=1 Tax=Elysia crispata TaxID=231223 RepID=A0AAE1AFZ2_9GAST|nr:hypothetical protein RRG08_015240 [Elysia crispata]
MIRDSFSGVWEDNVLSPLIPHHYLLEKRLGQNRRRRERVASNSLRQAGYRLAHHNRAAKCCFQFLLKKGYIKVLISVFSDQVTAFSAGLSQPRSLEAHQNVVFDHVYVNTGGGYNSGTGVFTCPTAGLYMFQINALTKIDHSMWLKLYHNNNYICSVWGRTSSEYVPGSNTVILDLAQNDRVRIQSHSESHLYGAISDIYGTFSGYRIGSGSAPLTCND